jgi:hypothetical protein
MVHLRPDGSIFPDFNLLGKRYLHWQRFFETACHSKIIVLSLAILGNEAQIAKASTWRHGTQYRDTQHNYNVNATVSLMAVLLC